jgi:hypothetical protein
VKEVGTGSMMITKSVPDSIVMMDLNFMENGVAKAAYVLNDDAGKTKIIWTFDTEAGANPLFRIMGKFMDKMVGPDFEKGLGKLKQELEENH